MTSLRFSSFAYLFLLLLTSSGIFAQSEAQAAPDEEVDFFILVDRLDPLKQRKLEAGQKVVLTTTDGSRIKGKLTGFTPENIEVDETEIPVEAVKLLKVGRARKRAKIDRLMLLGAPLAIGTGGLLLFLAVFISDTVSYLNLGAAALILVGLYGGVVLTGAGLGLLVIALFSTFWRRRFPMRKWKLLGT